MYRQLHSCRSINKASGQCFVPFRKILWKGKVENGGETIHTSPVMTQSGVFTTLRKKHFKNHVGKGENADIQEGFHLIHTGIISYKSF